MATKSANLYARIEPDVKEQAEGILAALGIPASNAINMFYKQIILQRGLPFEVKMPSARPVDVSALSEAQMNAELEKGYADMQAGRTRSAKSVFADIRNADKSKSSNDEVYTWLAANAHNYGFILRYPQGKQEITGTSYEPWHYRYVGVDAAREIYEREICLEEYFEQ